MSLRRVIENVEEGVTEALAPWASEEAQIIFGLVGVGGPVIVYEALKVIQAITYCQISQEMCEAGVRALLSLYP